MADKYSGKGDSDRNQSRDAGFLPSPLKWDAWIMRVMNTQPERICDPAELAEWKIAQQAKQNTKKAGR